MRFYLFEKFSKTCGTMDSSRICHEIYHYFRSVFRSNQIYSIHITMYSLESFRARGPEGKKCQTGFHYLRESRRKIKGECFFAWRPYPVASCWHVVHFLPTLSLFSPAGIEPFRPPKRRTDPAEKRRPRFLSYPPPNLPFFFLFLFFALFHRFFLHLKKKNYRLAKMG